MKWESLTRFKTIINNTTTNEADILIMDSLLAEAKSILSGEYALAA